MPRRTAPAFAAVSIVLAVLAGCAPAGQGGDPTSEPTTGPSETATPSPEATDPSSGIPVDATCDQLISPDTLYLYNPNFGTIGEFTPQTGSPAASALAHNGIACRWQNQTNGQNIDVSVAQLDAEALTALKNTAFEDSEMVPTYGEEAYFTVDESGVGVAQVFQGSYWIVAESPVFFEPGDATEIVQSVITALG